MPSGNYLSLDVGTARIGVAIARGGVRLAHPLTTIPAGDDSYHAIGQIVIQEQIDTIIEASMRIIRAAENRSLFSTGEKVSFKATPAL